MEYLRAVESTKNDFGNSTLKQVAFSNSNKKKRQCHVAFEEDEQLLSFCAAETDYYRAIPEPPPTSSLQLPYWQMRVVMNTIVNGGFITPTVFVPKSVWMQLGVKFSGLSTKTAAFQEIVSVLTNYIFPLASPKDGSGPLSDLTIYQVLTALRSCREEFHKLQNHLAKPFPFINEIHVYQRCFDDTDFGTAFFGRKSAAFPFLKGQQLSTRLVIQLQIMPIQIASFSDDTLENRASAFDFKFRAVSQRYLIGYGYT